ncbi:MAG: DEAD/DEAH box helicase family protein [Spirochaetes bacterium]|nr:DEAD/DEAH box helicase family protein [Spirochaetota bacterium]
MVISKNYILIDEIKEKIKETIENYQGGEIFFGCLINENSEIYYAESLCFGNDEAVLAPYELSRHFDAILHNHPSGSIKPSENDLYIASELQNEGIGFFIINNNAEKLNTVVPPIMTLKSVKLDKNFITDFFSDEGLLKEHKDDYEYREVQQKMSEKIADAFNDDKISVIEAGTGIGKSLAYLLPSFLWCKNNNQRVVIATNTINLQNQLYNKDIPFIKKILKSKINALIVKGRRNYICKLKLYNLQNELEFYDKNEEINSILKWSNITTNGDIDDLNFIPDNNVWEKVSSDVDFCTGRHCIFFQNCFYQLARRKASESQILIANHHILFADIQIRSEGRGLEENLLLPPYKKIIIDEAHNIEKNASSFFSFTFSKSSFLKFLSYLKKKNNTGFLSVLMKKLLSKSDKKSKEFGEIISNEILEKFSLVQINSNKIFDALSPYFLSKTETNYTNGFMNKFNLYRIKKNEWESEKFNKDFLVHFNTLMETIDVLAKSMEDFIQKFDKSSLAKDYEIDIKLLISYYNKLLSYVTNINNILNIDINEYITWIETKGNDDNPNFKLTATPLYVNKILSKNLFEAFDTIVLTSATLTINKSFDFFNKLTGLNLVKEKEIHNDIYESPFDYENKVLFVVPDYVPEPNHRDYNEILNDYLKKTIMLTEGSSFVLFTSYNQLKKSYDEVCPLLKENGLNCYCQGEMEKFKLLDTFIKEIKSTLFATNSFWEGVDAPGKTLKQVILAKLPFQMPTEPVEEAKIEDMEKRGLNPFMDYTLPSAIIKFKQGFGRLIRNKDDYGIVAIIDTRILKKYYGKLFFHSLPKCKFISGSLDKILQVIDNHINDCEKKMI